MADGAAGNRAIAYVRVSTSRQADEGNSISNQENRIRDYAKLRGLKLLSRDVVIDDGVSGGIPLWDREGGGLLLDRIDTGKFDHVIAVKLDRLFRIVGDALDTIDYLHSEDIGVHIIDLNGQALDTSSSMGRFFITMMAALAEMERGLISERTQEGMAYLKDNHLQFTRSIYGWDAKADGSLVPNWKEQDIIDYMAWQMKKNGMSATSVARSLNKKLSRSDREKMDQYLTSLSEVESRLIAAEKWIDIPLKKQDYTHLDLNVTSEGEPREYYRNMFDLIALAFDADITRSVAFMLNREDGMGISDTFPLKLGLNKTHHSLSHAYDKDGQLQFAKYDMFLSEQLAYFFGQLQQYQDRSGSVLDNSIVLFGSGASTTHNPKNLPTLVAGGANMGLKHGTYWRKNDTPMSNLYLSILHSLGIRQEAFSDSTGVLRDSIFAGV